MPKEKKERVEANEEVGIRLIRESDNVVIDEKIHRNVRKKEKKLLKRRQIDGTGREVEIEFDENEKATSMRIIKEGRVKLDKL